MASGSVGSAFSYQITATNSPTSYSATGLPAGLSVNTPTGLISGTPTAAGTSTVTVGATNGNPGSVLGGGTGTATLTLTISAGGAPVISSATSASGTVGTPFSYQIAATNSPTSYSATGLPACLSVNTANGLISGTPTSAATSTVTLAATNAAGTGNSTLSLTIALGAPVVTSATSASGTVGDFILLPDHGHQFTHELQCHRFACLIGQHCKRVDLRDADIRHNIDGYARCDQRCRNWQLDFVADHRARRAGSHQRHLSERDRRNRIRLPDHRHQLAHQLQRYGFTGRFIGQCL